MSAGYFFGELVHFVVKTLCTILHLTRYINLCCWECVGICWDKFLNVSLDVFSTTETHPVSVHYQIWVCVYQKIQIWVCISSSSIVRQLSKLLFRDSVVHSHIYCSFKVNEMMNNRWPVTVMNDNEQLIRWWRLQRGCWSRWVLARCVPRRHSRTIGRECPHSPRGLQMALLLLPLETQQRDDVPLTADRSFIGCALGGEECLPAVLYARLICRTAGFAES